MTPTWILNSQTWGKRPEGYTCLHFAAEGSDKSYNRLHLVQKLLEWRAEVDARNAKGNTALMLASGTGVVDIQWVLIEHGANPEVLNDRDLTAVQAAMGSSGSATRLLLNLGHKPPKRLVPSAKQRAGVGAARRVRRMQWCAYNPY